MTGSASWSSLIPVPLHYSLCSLLQSISYQDAESETSSAKQDQKIPFCGRKGLVPVTNVRYGTVRQVVGEATFNEAERKRR